MRQTLCAVLLTVFGIDAAINLIHPRTGTGITTTLTK
jgi:hypothetical protein